MSHSSQNLDCYFYTFFKHSYSMFDDLMKTIYLTHKIVVVVVANTQISQIFEGQNFKIRAYIVE